MRLKPESRIVLCYPCREGFLAIIYRGKTRVEAVFHAPTLEALAASVRSSRFYPELRAAWPERFASLLNLESVESLDEYLGSCSICLHSLASSLCNIFSVSKRNSIISQS